MAKGRERAVGFEKNILHDIQRGFVVAQVGEGAGERQPLKSADDLAESLGVMQAGATQERVERGVGGRQNWNVYWRHLRRKTRDGPLHYKSRGEKCSPHTPCEEFITRKALTSTQVV